MNYTELYENIRRKGSFLCVGLDTDPAKIPACVRERHGDASILAFNKAIIDATAPYTMAYKPNIAFYEAEGVSGWQQLAETVRYIRSNHPDILIIADAKRGCNPCTLHGKRLHPSFPPAVGTLGHSPGHDLKQVCRGIRDSATG